jgi:hypothetical protein
MEPPCNLGEFERCLNSMKRLLPSNQNNLSLLHNIALSEWYINHDVDSFLFLLSDLLSRKDSCNIDRQYLVFSFNVCAIHYLSGECNKAKDILVSLLNTSSKCALVLKFTLLLSEIFFATMRSDTSAMISIEWNSLIECLSSYLKGTETNSPEIRNYLTFRLHLLNCKFFIMTNQLKSAKKEIKMAMEMYYHQIKKFELSTFAELLSLFHYTLPNTRAIESAIDVNRELIKEGCIVHLHKVNFSSLHIF